MRARKLAAAAAEDLPPEDGADLWPAPAEEEAAADRAEDTTPLADLCIACGVEGCREHGEIARLDAPSRVVREAVARLARAVAEQRAAARALRVLVLTEVARGRGDLEVAPTPKEEPCPRCAIRDAEQAAAAAGVTKATRRRQKGDEGQQALPFKA
jgi:hypothetical protein